MDDYECGAIDGMRIPRGKSSTIVFTSNPTWPDPGSNHGRRGGKPMTNHLNYGTACEWPYIVYVKIDASSYWRISSSKAESYSAVTHPILTYYHVT
jgi:hypothetical protein